MAPHLRLSLSTPSLLTPTGSRLASFSGRRPRSGLSETTLYQDHPQISSPWSSVWPTRRRWRPTATLSLLAFVALLMFMVAMLLFSITVLMHSGRATPRGRGSRRRPRTWDTRVRTLIFWVDGSRVRVEAPLVTSGLRGRSSAASRRRSRRGPRPPRTSSTTQTSWRHSSRSWVPLACTRTPCLRSLPKSPRFHRHAWSHPLRLHLPRLPPSPPSVLDFLLHRLLPRARLLRHVSSCLLLLSGYRRPPRRTRRDFIVWGVAT